MSKKNKLIIFAAVLMVLLVSVPSISAYFSTFTMTKGSKKIVIQNSSYMKEEVKSWAKHIVVEADDDSDPVFVRVRAFAPDNIQSLLTYESEGDLWYDGEDGYYYYRNAIDGKTPSEGEDLYAKETVELKIRINESLLPTDVKEGDNFHIVVVYEATPINRPFAGGNE